ncbi:MAG TPA: hypothetical protein VLH79_08685 [Chthonomonadales bacterium]|nr:hypothetical protein [Chthonomonadales bacterium]
MNTGADQPADGPAPRPTDLSEGLAGHEAERAADLVSEVLAAGRYPHMALKMLERVGPGAARDALLDALGTASDSRSYSRLVQGLARLEDDSAFAMLAREAREQRRFPRLAVRALGASRHGGAVRELEALLTVARGPRRVTAALVLADRRSALAVEPLLGLLRSGGRNAPAARRALGRFGHVPAIARAVLSDLRIGPRDAARILQSVEAHLRIGLFSRAFDARAFLEREAANPRSPVHAAAVAAKAALEETRLLLRPSADGSSATLLRAAGRAPTDGGADDLLRAAAQPEDDRLVDAEMAQAPWWRRLLGRAPKLRDR